MSKFTLFSKVDLSGGCGQPLPNVNYTYLKMKNSDNVRLYNRYSTNNDCFLSILKAHGTDNRQTRTIRKILGFEANTPISLSQTQAVGEHYKVSFIVYDESWECLAKFIDPDDTIPVKILLKDGHYSEFKLCEKRHFTYFNQSKRDWFRDGLKTQVFIKPDLSKSKTCDKPLTKIKIYTSLDQLKKCKNDHAFFLNPDVESTQLLAFQHEREIRICNLNLFGLKTAEEALRLDKICVDKTGQNLHKYFSTAMLAYNSWTQHLNFDIEIPKDVRRIKMIRNAIYGARIGTPTLEPIHYRSQAKSYEDMLKNNDYVYATDVSSLYPATYKFPFPVGRSRFSDKGEKEYLNKKIGIYHISWKRPKSCKVGVLPVREAKQVNYNRIDFAGYYTSVDISNAFNAGYEITFLGECLIWDEYRNHVFTDFLETWRDLKENGDEFERKQAKSVINRLYGKTIQKPRTEKFKSTSKYIKSDEFKQRWVAKDIIVTEDGERFVVAQIKNSYEAKHNQKPMQLGAFILAYSRKIMLDYMEGQEWLYTHTDSLWLKGSKGKFTPKAEAKIGDLTSNFPDESLLVKEFRVYKANTYWCKLINPNNKVVVRGTINGLKLYREENGMPPK